MRPEHKQAIHDGGAALSGGRPDNIHRDKRLDFSQFTAPARQPESLANLSNANANQVVNVLRMIASQQSELTILEKTGISDTLYSETLELLAKIVKLYERPVKAPAKRSARKPDGRKTVRKPYGRR